MSSVSAREGLAVEATGARPLTLRRRFVAILVAAPAVLVPIIVVLAIYWARQSFYQQSPAGIVAGSRTISRAISDPGIADIFAPTVSLAALFLAAVVWRIVLLLRGAIDSALAHEPRAGRIARVALALAAIAEACGIFGMVLLSWLSESHLHIGGSYLFFFGQASAIVASGMVCRVVLRTLARDDAPGWSKSGLSPRLSRLRAGAAPAIAAAALVFWIAYLVRDSLDRTPGWLERAFSGLEIALIVSFLLYLATFSLELYRAQLGTDRSSAQA